MKALNGDPRANRGGTLSYQTHVAFQPKPFGPITVADGAAGVLTKPRLRGWIHSYCAVAAVIAGTPLVAVSWAEASKRAGHSTLTYTLAIVAMFAVSAIYHRVDWVSAAVRNWMRRLDH